MIGIGLDCLKPIQIPVEGHKGYYLRVPCGHCLNCKARRTREWSVRLLMESKYYDYDHIAFVTLTYDNEHLHFHKGSGAPTLYKTDCTNFFKRLRKNLDYPIRMFTVGEYGSLTSRPHLHSIIFGLSARDDNEVAFAWKNGFVDVRPFLKGASEYVSGYVQKKLYGPDAELDLREPEFMHCSQRLGLLYFLDHFNEIDPENPLLPFKEGCVAVPRTFRRYAQDPEWCAKHHLKPWPKLDNYAFAVQQGADLNALKTFLEGQNVDLITYDHNREVIANERFVKYQASRMKNTEV